MTPIDLVARQKRADMLNATREVARKLRPLLDADVRDLIEARERDLLNAVIEADTDTRRLDCVADVKAWRRLIALITNAVQAEAYAETKLKEINHG